MLSLSIQKSLSLQNKKLLESRDPIEDVFYDKPLWLRSILLMSQIHSTGLSATLFSNNNKVETETKKHLLHTFLLLVVCYHIFNS